MAIGDPTKPTHSGTSLTEQIEAASSGATIELLPNTVYREKVTITKPITLLGSAGSEIRGADVWTGWSGTGPWTSTLAVPAMSEASDVQAQAGTSRPFWPEQVFYDGVELTQVADNPQSGQFALNASRQVILADDPSGHIVEVTTRPQWVIGSGTGATDVVIDDIGFRYAGANSTNAGAALWNGNKARWEVRNCDIGYAHGKLLSMASAPGCSIHHNEIHHAGQAAFGGFKSVGLVIDSNHIHDINTEWYSESWEAGNKVVGATDIQITNNHVHHVRGNGIWLDVDCQGGLIERNRVHHCSRNGIHYEVSNGSGGSAPKAYIRYNTVYLCGWTDDGQSARQGIMATASKDLEIAYNTIAFCARGIRVIDQTRAADRPQYRVANVEVHHNDIIHRYHYRDTAEALGWIDQVADGLMFAAAQNNSGHDNRYHFPVPEDTTTRFSWAGSHATLAAFNATAGEENGVYLTDAERNRIMAQNDLPFLEWFDLTASADDRDISRTATTYAGLDSASTSHGTGPTARAERSLSAGNYTVGSILLKRDTSALPDDAVALGARIRAEVSAASLPGHGKLTADWQSWTGVGVDWVKEAPTGALAEYDADGLSTAGTYYEMPLDNGAGISPTGTTYLRLHLKKGEPTLVSYWEMKTTNDAAARDPSLVVEYTVFPARPTGLTATASAGQIDLEWADNTDADIAGYNVYRALIGGGPHAKVNTALITASAYTDTGLSGDVTYYYVARAVDLSGNESGDSLEVSATPPPDTVIPGGWGAIRI